MSPSRSGSTARRAWRRVAWHGGRLLVGALLLIQPGPESRGRSTARASRPDSPSDAIVDAALPLDATMQALREQLAAGDPMAVFSVCPRLLHRVERTDGDRSLAAAEVLDLMVECAGRGAAVSGRRSQELAARAVAIKRERLGDRDPRTATSLRNLGILHEVQGRTEAAHALYVEARDIVVRAYGAEDPRAAMLGNDVGIAAARLGRYAEALGEFRAALAALEAATPHNELDLAFVLNGLGITLYEVGDYTAARNAHERALALRSTHLPPEHPKIAETLNNLGALLAAMGDVTPARELFERVLAIRRRTYGELHPLTASALVNVARLQLEDGERAEAEASYAGALRILEARNEDAALVICQLGLGSLYEDAAHWDGALELYGKALHVGTQALGAEHPHVAAALDRLARVHYARGDLESARAYSQKALALNRRNLGDDHPDTAHSLVLMATVLAESGDAEAAYRLAAEAEALGRGQQEHATHYLAEREALLFAGMRARGLDLMQRLALSAPGDAKTSRTWEAVMRARALILYELVERSRAVAVSDDAELGRCMQAYRRACTRYANLAFQESHGDAGLMQAKRREAAQGLEVAERALAAKSLEFRVWRQQREIGLDAIAHSLPADGAMISYSVYRRPQRFGAWMDTVPELAAFVLRPATPPRLFALGPLHAIDSLVALWGFEAAVGVGVKGRSNEESEIAYRHAGTALRRAIWEPLEPLLEGATQIFVVPDRALHLVNLAALRRGSVQSVRDGYLADTGRRFHTLASERDLVPGVQTPAGHGLLAMGGADFDFAAGAQATERLGVGAAARPYEPLDTYALRGAPPCTSLDDLRFGPLPGTVREVRDLAALWANAEDILVLTGAEASDVAFKANAPGKRLLHLATHGFFLDGSCLPAPDRTRGIRLRQRPQEEPVPRSKAALLRSGLALAGANLRGQARSGGEDGILTAEEIAALDLRGVEWAVLSACNTGLGEVRLGEGVLGVRRAFQVAGARAVIMSLWPVADEPTREWMQALYTARLRGGLGAAAAVQRADAVVLAARRARGESTHPFFWAGFVSTGDWR